MQIASRVQAETVKKSRPPGNFGRWPGAAWRVVRALSAQTRNAWADSTKAPLSGSRWTGSESGCQSSTAQALDQSIDRGADGQLARAVDDPVVAVGSGAAAVYAH